MSEITITILVENTVNQTGLQAEHGLSLWIRRDHDCVLLDTGQTRLFAENAGRLGINIASATAIAISHGHYDHTGGLSHALQLNRDAVVHVHPDAFKPHFSNSRDVGIPLEVRRSMEAHGGRLARYDSPVEIAAGFFLTGTVPRINDWEDTGGPFFHDAANQQPDALRDDQALYFDTSQGTVIVCGCSHAGIANIITHVRTLTSRRSIACVVGGLHLVHADAQRIAKTCQFFTELDIAQLAPLHCTAFPALVALWQQLPGRVLLCATGDRLVFQE